MDPQEITFLRRKDYQFLRELGRGSCGRTLLLKDPEIDELVVCKKYAPESEAWRTKLFQNFLEEIKVLHRLSHPNIVRLFNYHVFRERLAGYIVMEYIDGTDIHTHLEVKPQEAASIFGQVVAGFRKLEESRILHRDIRPANILVRNDGFAKIIDFGFGKTVKHAGDFDKSVSLNWWCDPPNEFARGIYDFRTEVYFVGKLFEAAVRDYDIAGFPYLHLLSGMCTPDPLRRIESFVAVDQAISGGGLSGEEFGDDEINCYRRFTTELHQAITRIESSTTFLDDVDAMQVQLERAYRNCLLEEWVPDGAQVVNCFLRGQYYLRKQVLTVGHLRDFLNMLKTCTRAKRQIVIANLQTKLSSLPRYADAQENDIPF